MDREISPLLFRDVPPSKWPRLWHALHSHDDARGGFEPSHNEVSSVCEMTRHFELGEIQSVPMSGRIEVRIWILHKFTPEKRGRLTKSETPSAKRGVRK